MDMAIIIFAELWVSFFTNVRKYGTHFSYMGGTMGHISTNMGGIGGPNFELKWRVPVQTRFSYLPQGKTTPMPIRGFFIYSKGATIVIEDSSSLVLDASS